MLPNSPLATGARQPQLLLVDDDPAAIHVMRNVLSDFQNLRFASTGAEALRLARQNPPDLVVLDAQMPGMDGLDVAAEMRQDSRLAHVPVIMATAQPPQTLELRALQTGVSDFITKPLVPEVFRARVKARLKDRVPAAAAVVPGARPHLLIVDDDPMAVQLLGAVLQDEGTVSFVSSGQAALARVRTQAPDLVLLDLHMPGVDGFDVCRDLKACPELRTVPVVIVTRYSDPEREERALALGADDFISKPYVAAVLRARVRNLLLLKRRNDAALRAEGERWRRLADARLSDAIRTASDGILICDEQQQVMLANTAAAALWQQPAEDLVGRRLQDLPGWPADALQRAHQAAVRIGLQRADGGTEPVELVASTVAEPSGSLTTCVLRSVADRERLEAETHARLAAEAANNAKSRMLGVIVHEMGNPLNAVIGFAQLLRDGQAPLPERPRVWVQQLMTGAQQLLRLLGDLREFARQGGDLRLDIGPRSLAEGLRTAVLAQQPAADDAGVHLQLDSLDPTWCVRADAGRLVQCLNNLLSNAIKYNHRGGWVRVQVRRQARDGGEQLCVAVHDSGLGLDARQLAGLFEPFNRLGRESSDIPGTGLGLTITRHLVQAMGGRLAVQSRPGHGSCFELWLPCA